MDVVAHAEAASRLVTAYATGRPVEPLSETYADLSVDDAYEIQLLQIRRRCAGGAVVKGHKVGLTSTVMQRQMNVDQPDYGHLLNDMFYLEHFAIDGAAYLQPRIEPEMAFVLGRPLRGPGVTVAEAASAVAFVLPALEIIDSRIRDWQIGLCDTIADNASSGGVVLGSRPTSLAAVDLKLAGCNLYRNGELVATGAGGAVLGSPISSLVWLANTLGVRGIVLEAGHVVLPGSVTASVAIAPGDSFAAVIAGLGTVTARFTAADPKESS